MTGNLSGGQFEQRLREAEEGARDGAPLGGTKAEANQRLQVGLTGIGSMVLLVGLASIIGGQAARTEMAAVPDAAPTTEPIEVSPQSDPLADAGIVPDIPAEPETDSEVPDLPLPAVEGADSPNDLEAPLDMPEE